MVYNKLDFKTSTSVGLKFQPPVSQEFERIPEREKIYPQLRQPIIQPVKDTFTTTHQHQFTYKIVDKNPSGYASLPYCSKRVQNGRSFEEKMFSSPPEPLKTGITEVQSQYRMNLDALCVPNEKFIEKLSDCPEVYIGRKIQAPYKPGEKSYVKWLDIYLSQSKATHVPFTIEQQNDIVGRKNVTTFYDYASVSRSRGFGVRNPPACEPLLSIRKQPVYDKLLFKTQASNRVLPKLVLRVPHKGMESESQAEYVPYKVPKTQSILHIDVYYEDSLPKPSAYQNLAPPGMYSTDYRHLGTGWPVRSVVDPGCKRVQIINEKCYHLDD